MQDDPLPNPSSRPESIRSALAGLLTGLILGLIVAPQPIGAMKRFTTVDGKTVNPQDPSVLRRRDDNIRLFAGTMVGPLIGAGTSVLMRRFTSLNRLVAWTLSCWCTGLLIGVMIAVINAVTPTSYSISPDYSFVILTPPALGLIWATSMIVVVELATLIVRMMAALAGKDQ